MSGGGEERSEFEQRAREVLDDSVTRASGHVRSRLNQARQAAIAEIAAGATVRPRSIWRPVLMPAAGAAVAAGVVAAVLLGTPGLVERGLGGEGHAGFEDIDLLSDREGLELIENGDRSFYEWAVAAGEEGDGGASG
jgi:hypothetical protein